MLQSAPPHLRHFIVHLENTMWCTSTPKDRRSLHGTGVSAAKALGIPVVWHLREFVDLYGETPVFFDTEQVWKKINRADKVV